MIKLDLPATLGMSEMETAAAFLVARYWYWQTQYSPGTPQSDPGKWGFPFYHDIFDGKSRSLRVGLACLLAYGWLEPAYQNGYFRIRDNLWTRLEHCAAIKRDDPGAYLPWVLSASFAKEMSISTGPVMAKDVDESTRISTECSMSPTGKGQSIPNDGSWCFARIPGSGPMC